MAETFRQRVKGGARLAGTFVKTPAIEVIEVLATSGLDFLCLDAEHAPFDRARLDACLAIGRALGVPMLVRVAEASAAEILQALDSGADGIVVPHVDSAAKAADVVRWSRFGRGGRGYAGSSRWAAFAGRSMTDNLSAAAETLVIAQIEDIEGVENVDEIAAVPGLDGLFLGPADLSVAYGYDTQTSPELTAATAATGAAATANRLAYMTFVADAKGAEAKAAEGFTVFFVASEHVWMRAGAAAVAKGIAAF